MHDRKLKEGWLKSYLNYIERQESPEIYHLWVGISIISASLRRRVYIDRESYELYPNSYIVLVSDSGVSRKSGAMEIGLDLLDNIDDIFTIHGKATPEGLADVMGRITQTPDGKIIPDGSVFLHSDELSGIFGQSSYVPDLVSFMLAVYSSKTKVDFVTRSKGIVSVRNPCLTVLSATTPEQLSDLFTSSTMKAGISGRILFIWNSKRTTRVSKPKLRKSMVNSLVADLKAISKLYGIMTIEPDAERIFDNWYNKYEPPADAELSPFAERIHDHVLKTSMILSVSESDSKIIRPGHMESAILAVDRVEQLLPAVYSTVGATAESKIGRIILKVLQRHAPEPVSHSVLLRRVYKHVQNAEVFKRIIETLEETKKISREISSHGEFYKLRYTDEKD